MTEQVSLKNLLVPSKETEVEFPGMPGFKVKLCHLGREPKSKLIKKATVTKYKNHQAVQELDDDQFLKAFSRATVKGWTGLKYSYLETLLPVELNDMDPEDCLPFDDANAELLLGNSEAFDAWVVEIVGELENFIQSKSKES